MTVFVLRPENARERMAAAWRFACQFLELEQNSRMWALLTDVSREVVWP